MIYVRNNSNQLDISVEDMSERWAIWLVVLLYFLHQNILWFLELEIFLIDGTSSAMWYLGKTEQLKVLQHWPVVSAFPTTSEMRDWTLVHVS